MVDRYEQLVTLRYLENLLRSGAHVEKYRAVRAFLEDSGKGLGLELPATTSPAQVDEEIAALDARWDDLRALIQGRLAELRGARPDRIERNLRAICTALDFNARDRALLGLLVRQHIGGAVDKLFDALGTGPEHPIRKLYAALETLLGFSRADVIRRLQFSAPLLAGGVVQRSGGDVRVLGRVLWAVQTASIAKADAVDHLLGKPLGADLGWEDFDHVAADRDQIEGILRQATARPTKGIHILLYGSAGTGKTEFCKTVAARVGVPLYSVGEADGADDEPCRCERLGSYRVFQRLLGSRGRAILLFDEMEDLVAPGLPAYHGPFEGAEAGSRVFVHRLLEDSTVPTLWTINDIERVRPAILRRMTYALEMKVPDPKVRARVWRRVLEREKVAASDEEVLALARQFEAPPALTANAVRSAALTGGGVTEMRRAVTAISKALHGGVPPRLPQETAIPLDLALFNSTTDLAALTDKLTGVGARRTFSLCLYGPPGTGKSVYVRHLADRMEMEILQKRTSDLLSPWVGETESRIARAFEEARSAGAFLVFDEADSLLSDRRGAVRSWEVTQVNEMLARMESHDLPFACTTNLFERLDEASLRRFTFKIELHFLTPAQAAAAFRLFLALDPLASLSSLSTLTPGDFAAVARRADLLALPRDSAALVAMLAEECALKKRRSRPIGFGALAPELMIRATDERARGSN